MNRILLIIAIGSFTSQVSANKQAFASDKSAKFMRADKIIVVFSENGKIAELMKTNVVGILPNGDRKIYGEKLTNIDRSTGKVTLSATVPLLDISADGTAQTEDLINLTITNRKFINNKKGTRRRWRHKKHRHRNSAMKKEKILHRIWTFRRRFRRTR